MNSVNPDIPLTVGLVILVLAIPAIVGAISDRRTPRVASVAILIGGGLLVWALATKPGGYTLVEIPEAVSRVVAMVIN